MQDRAEPLVVQADSTAAGIAFDSAGVAPAETARAAGEPAARGPIDVNSASTEELIQLPGIGPTKAKSIIETRARLGRFARVSDLLQVPGIGPKTLERIAPLVAAGAPDSTTPAVARAAAAASAPTDPRPGTGRAE
jgi:competence protein ComEA